MDTICDVGFGHDLKCMDSAEAWPVRGYFVRTNAPQVRRKGRCGKSTCLLGDAAASSAVRGGSRSEQTSE